MDWVVEELKGLSTGDERLNKRAEKVLSRLGGSPSDSIPTACRGWDETIAAYRFFQNEKVTPEVLLKPHVDASIRRMKEQRTVLLVQDTTELDYTRKKEKIEGLGVLNHERRRGLLFHSLVAFSPDRVCQGVLDLNIWSRKEEEFGKTKDRQHRALEDKESYRWVEGYRKAQQITSELPDTEVLMVADSEADLYDLFEEAAALEEGKAHWLVRGKHDRALSKKHADNSAIRLLEDLRSQKVLGYLKFDFAKKGRKKRKVRQSIRACRVTLRPPYRSHEKFPPREITVLLASETHPAKGEEPLEWLLLTSRSVTSFEEATTLIDYYLCRWQIEVFFRTLKSGCRVEDLQLEKTAHLLPCLAFYSIVAWRVLFVTLYARECPDLPCDVLFNEEEWKALYVVAKRKKPPNKPPPLKVFVSLLATFGGHLGRKSDAPPGAKAIWIGLQRMRDFVLAYHAFSEAHR